MLGIVGKNDVYKSRDIIKQISSFLKKKSDKSIFQQVNNQVVFGVTEQFIHSQDYTLQVAGDIRLDNQQELSKKLQLSQMESVKDEEYILLSYQKWQEKCLEHLIGNFSFVIWDQKKQYLFCAKSKSSTNPFFYINNESLFAFSSEVAPLLKVPGFKVVPNFEAMQRFYYYNGIIGPDMTMYKDVFALPHGHYMIVDKTNIRIHRYWKPETIKINKKITQQEAAKKFYDLLNQAVECRLRSDGPIGLELSGGLDSSSVVSLAAKHRDKHSLYALTMKYGDYLCDESEYSDAVIEKTGIEQISIEADKIDYKNKYTLDYYYQLCPEWPNYITTTQFFPLMKKAKEKGINLVLTGQGGDGITQGHLYRLADYLKNFQWGKLISEIAHIKCSCKYKMNIVKSYVIAPMLSDFAKEYIKKHFLKRNSYDDKKPMKFKELIDESLCQSYATCEHMKNMTGTLLANWTNNNTYQIMKQFGMEFWHPFFDSRLIEFAFTLPDEFKSYKDGFKITLKAAMDDLLPDVVKQRNDKAEFSEAIRDQIDAIDLENFWAKKYIIELGVIPQEELLKSINDYKNSTFDDLRVTALWRLINLEYWYRYNFVEN